MGEVDELPEPRTVPIDPTSLRLSRTSSSIRRGPGPRGDRGPGGGGRPTSPQATTASRAPAAISIAPVLDAVKGLGEQLARRLDSLQAILEREQRAEASRERVVDRLHAELQEYKQDLLLKVQRPIFVDLIQLHDDLGKMIEARPPPTPSRSARRPCEGPSSRSRPRSRISSTARESNRSPWREASSIPAGNARSPRRRPKIPA